MARRIIPWLTALRKRWLAVVALLTYLAGAIGFPLPVSVRAVPTQTPVALSLAPKPALRPCGCPAPEDGTRKCCCCTTPNNEPSATGCCGKPAGVPESASAGTAKKVRVTWAAGLWAWRCQGLQVLADAGVTLPPPVPLAFSPITLPPDRLAASGASPLRLVLPVPEPPPRMLCATS